MPTLTNALGFVGHASALAIAVVMTAGCARRATVPIDPAGLRREWTLVQLRDSAGEAALVPDSKVSLQFMENGRVGGRSSINQFGGTVELLSDGTISWSALTSTLMAGPPELMVQERRFLAALESTRQFRLDDERLTLTDSIGRVELRFVSADSGAR
jgi:heat shock protein HslJ